MNPELQKQLAEMLAKLTEAGTWAGEQIPPLVQEKILFGRVIEPLWMFVSIALMYGGYRAGRACQKIAVEAYDSDGKEFAGVMGVIGSVVVIVGGAVIFFSSIEPTIMAWLAPRLYILEWLKGMVTNKS